jgi:cytochrome b561
MDTPKRYHPLMVVLHWLTVVLLLGAGLLSESGSSPISIHMVLGSLLLVILIIRLIVRFTVKRPAWANTGNPFLNKLGELVHIGLYSAAFYILALGGLMASQRNLFGYALGTGSIARVNTRFLRALHELGWTAVLGLLFLHVGGAVYHQFIIKDNLLGRMWFRKRSTIKEN